MMLRALLALLYVPALILVVTAQASPVSAACDAAGGLRDLTMSCTFSAETLQQQADADSAAEYTVFQACFSGTSGEPEPCDNPRACTVGEATGTIYAVLRNGEYVGTACLTAGDTKEFRRDIGELAARAFRRLAWPGSSLSVQPPGGRTLVNFETIFFTTNAEPRTQSVTLLNKTVEIQARPVSYAWHFGDGTTLTTSSPGHPYPDQDVVHAYASVDSVAARVDTTYAGRFRVGGGEWRDIDDTVTVAGAEVGLTIVEATPQLVEGPGQ